MDPVSPELALVDPVLRRADLARLDAHPFSFVRMIPAANAGSRLHAVVPVAPRPRPRTRQVMVLLCIFAAGLGVANIAARSRSADRPVLLSASASSGAATDSVRLDERTRVERRILELVGRSPSRLPPALVDPATGLARNNLQATCERTLEARAYLCVVRPAVHRPGEGLQVRYGPSGRGGMTFTWFPYRSG